MRFILDDHILEVEVGKRILASKSVSLMDEYFNDHYAKHAIMPASMILECLAQTAGWLVQCGHNFNLYLVIVIVEGMRIMRPVRPGETLLLEAHLLHAHRHGATMRAEARVGSETVASAARLVFAYEESSDPGFAKRRRAIFDYVSGNTRLLPD